MIRKLFFFLTLAFASSGLLAADDEDEAPESDAGDATGSTTVISPIAKLISKSKSVSSRRNLACKPV